MSSDSDYDQFENLDDDRSKFTPVQGGSIKKGSYCMLREFPCRVINTATSKPGKHGSAKVLVEGVDIFTGKKYEQIFKTSATVWTPVITKVEYQVVDINEDGFVSLLLDDSCLKEDVCLSADAELGEALHKCWDDNNQDNEVYFTLLQACGKEKFIACRTKQHAGL